MRDIPFNSVDTKDMSAICESALILCLPHWPFRSLSLLSNLEPCVFSDAGILPGMAFPGRLLILQITQMILIMLGSHTLLYQLRCCDTLMFY